ncbi:MAG: hypothetical protein ACR2K5_14910, partial [Pseudolabrys sp.]
MKTLRRKTPARTAVRKKRPAKHRAGKARARKSGKPKKNPARADSSGSLASRIQAAPPSSAPVTARARVAAWLGEISKTTAGKALALLLAKNAKLRALVESLADGSPYLWQLASAEPPRLWRLLQSDPDRHLAALLADTAGTVAATDDEARAMHLLRRMKAEAALLIALADIGGVWPVMRATQALTELADAAVSSAVQFLLADAARAGNLSPRDRQRPQDGSGYIVLAMGKMGACELNYSSDIDLIVFFDPGAPALVEGGEPGQLFVRITRAL